MDELVGRHLAVGEGHLQQAPPQRSPAAGVVTGVVTGIVTGPVHGRGTGRDRDVVDDAGAGDLTVVGAVPALPDDTRHQPRHQPGHRPCVRIGVGHGGLGGHEERSWSMSENQKKPYGGNVTK